MPVTSIKDLKQHNIGEIFEPRVAWFRNYFNYLVHPSPFIEEDKLVTVKEGTGDNAHNALVGILIPPKFQDIENFTYMKQLFNYEQSGGFECCINEAENIIYFQFIIFFWLIDQFPEEDFSQKYRNQIISFLKLILQEKDTKYYVMNPQGEREIKKEHIDAFFHKDTSIYEKTAFVWYLYYKECFTEITRTFNWQAIDAIATSWKTGRGRFVGVIGDRAEVVLKELSYNVVFWDDRDFIPALTGVLETRGLRLLEKLSDKGSTAILYTALDLFTDEKRAIKVYMRVGKDIEQEYRSMREQLRRIKHPNIIQIITGGHFNFKGAEIYYFVEEYFDGKSLETISEGILESKDLRDRIKLCAMLANAIDAIHDAYEAHNDLHEGNVLVAIQPLALKVIDPRSSLRSPAQGSPDYNDFFTLIRRFITEKEIKELELPYSGEQESVAFKKFKDKLNILQNEQMNDGSGKSNLITPKSNNTKSPFMVTLNYPKRIVKDKAICPRYDSEDTFGLKREKVGYQVGEDFVPIGLVIRNTTSTSYQNLRTKVSFPKGVKLISINSIFPRFISPINNADTEYSVYEEGKGLLCEDLDNIATGFVKELENRQSIYFDRILARFPKKEDCYEIIISIDYLNAPQALRHPIPLLVKPIIVESLEFKHSSNKDLFHEIMRWRKDFIQ